MDDQEVNPTLGLAEQLIARPSITPGDAGCQELIAERLRQAGFDCVSMQHGPAGAVVSNLCALHRGTLPGPKVGLAGHTDLVPPGPAAAWATLPSCPHTAMASCMAAGQPT